jgi:micrococcal nuclease
MHAAKANPKAEPQVALYNYRARVLSVHDGDTCKVEIDLGLMMWKHGETIRLARINAPELTGKSAKLGKESRDHLKALIEGKEILLSTSRDKREKYGRYLGEIWLLSDGVYTNINDLLVANGHAEYKRY